MDAVATPTAIVREGPRLKEQSVKVLDEATRNRRKRRALEALEQDNFQDDPHGNLVMHKKAPKFEEALQDTSSSSVKRRSTAGRGAKSADYWKQKSRKNVAMLLEEELQAVGLKPPNYASARAGPSRIPSPKLCAVCGFFARYSCVTCGSKYCQLKCFEVHKETRCLKFIV